MILRTALLTVILLLPGSIGGAQVPDLQYSAIERTVDLFLVYDDDSESDDVTRQSEGPFNESLQLGGSGNYGSSAIALASQKTDISHFSVRGEGVVQGNASLADAEDAMVRARTISRVNLQFVVPVDRPYTLNGSFGAFGDSSVHANAAVTLVGSGPSFPFHSDGFYPGSEDDPGFAFSGTVLAGTTLTLLIEVQVDLMGDNYGDPPLVGVGGASFNFVLDFGDRDGDGLLDEWEEEGIDFDGLDPIDIDLPGLGADPDHKDLFVEIDVMEGVPFDQDALDRVVEVFASAPASMVNNPGGEPGINLHLLHDDGDRPPFTPLFFNDWSPFYAIKEAYFGSPGDRAPNPNASLIAEARSWIFRYCLWGDTLSASNGLLGGQGELVGDDFIVAGGTMIDLHQPEPTDHLAGVLMHELGHTLGLRHGGVEVLNDKPNYLSVMNYLYNFPIDAQTPQGTNVKDIWRLDYSRWALITLDETALDETVPLAGPSGRQIVFNSASDSFPDPIVPTIAEANNAVDWNNNGERMEPQTYQLDINRFSSDTPVEFQTALQSYSDWDRIWYHLSGDPDFIDRPAGSEGAPPIDLELWIFEELASFNWIDQTDPNRIFADDFESEATIYWSSTVP